MIRCLSALWLLALACTSLAQGVLEHPVQSDAQRERLKVIAAKLKESLPVQAQMEQRKHLSVLHEPMVSTGEFSLSAAGNMRWHIAEPFAVTYRVEGERIEREIEGERELITASSEPSVYGFFQVFSRLFELDLASLERHFTVYLAPEAESGRWDIALQPTGAPLNRLVALVLVAGQAGHIDKVTVTEPGDDYTELLFSYPERD
ncbi:outer membrane lipoprotein carrier protein LolA [Gilvimarinus algae]|uniref:Outer membrane lipoprotein carrier protein LolA n=1 Tax=Gilvimarinus algae TaxID=3058037 RepID=A0ABT8THS0_9GAMM|nr:outer membrane lipoprotein carrier protein LolA [Gilvimarinus sp. SDUM040014]MDO3383466.1 outer membrane lipoprotein carrier protein LolA [Gilvimarinus sp. SDUM040014]